jgi:uncharacterized cupredoxin-like copper-binding protein
MMPSMPALFKSNRSADATPRRLIVAVLALGACGAALLVAAAVARSQADAGPATIVVTMTDSKLNAAPMTAPLGSVVFKVVNKGTRPRDFEIAGKSTPQIASGKSATLKVTFPKTGTFLYLSYRAGHTGGLSNALRVVATCTHPTTSTVRVQMKEAPEILSQTRVPCGTVTFVLTNVGKIVHSFDVFAPDNATVVPPGGHGPRVKPGQTARMTVRFTMKGRVLYTCGETEHGEMYGELGYLFVV